MNMKGKARPIAAWVLSSLLTALFIGSASAKLMRAPPVVEMFEKWGLGNEILLIGCGELASALLFLIPRTHSLGVLLLSAYMGGAIVTHMQHGENYGVQSVILALIWVAGCLRRPELLGSFFPQGVSRAAQVAACLMILSASGIAARGDEGSPSALERDPAGWTNLLAGPDAMKQWTRGPIPPEGKLNPISQWTLDPKTGMLVCEGDRGHEWLRYDRELGDSVFHVEWRFTPIEGKKGYNSGIYARNSADARIWHQAQTGSESGGFLFGDTPVKGRIKRINHGKQRPSRVKPAGEWNTFEITSHGPDITLWVNGAVADQFRECEVKKGYVGLEAEGYRIEFRSVLLKVLGDEKPAQAR